MVSPPRRSRPARRRPSVRRCSSHLRRLRGPSASCPCTSAMHRAMELSKERPLSDSSPETTPCLKKRPCSDCCPVATGRCSTALTVATNCAETDPEQSSRALRPVCWHGETWRREQTTVYYDCKQSVPHLFLCSCTCLILGLGPQTKPPSMTTHHGLVTSHERGSP